MSNTTLFFFTASYPFGKGESFIENEIYYLSKKFPKIVILPFFEKNDGPTRVCPKNVIVLDPIVKSTYKYRIVGILGLRRVFHCIKKAISDNVFFHFRWIKEAISSYLIINNVIASKSFNYVMSTASNSDIFYLYWGFGVAYALPFLQKKCKIVVRFHGFDLYEDRRGGYISFRKELLSLIDIAVLISKHGKDYLLSKYPKISAKCLISYLGTNDYGISSKSTDGILRIVSCSFIYPLKRVHLIFQALQCLSIPVIWTHIGDGEDFDDMSQKILSARSGLKVNLLGRISNQDIMKYYSSHCIDLFINTSLHEGLPVSMMEAISFDIPIIATNVGGVSEIVNSETGVLLDVNSSANEIAAAILYLQNHTEYYHPRKYWENNFNAAKNYPHFIEECLLES